VTVLSDDADAATVRIVTTSQGVVAEPLDDVPPLTDAIVRSTLEAIRRRDPSIE
jgi:hypothetical protein